MKKWWEKGKNKAKRRRTPPPTKNFPLVGAKLIFLGGGNNMIHFHNIYAWKYMCTFLPIFVVCLMIIFL